MTQVLPPTETGSPSPRAPRPLAERRRRLETVEQALASLIPTSVFAPRLAKEFGVTAWTIIEDVKRVRRLWLRIDERGHRHARSLWFRRMRLLSRKAEQEGELATAAAIERTIGQALGLLAPATNLTNVAVSVGGPVDFKQLVMLAGQSATAAGVHQELPRPGLAQLTTESPAATTPATDTVPDAAATVAPTGPEGA